ncbi:MAG: prolyl oligopeptidase family serine peptidase, partial [Anaerolineales bacterium]|nr:prolyl oligopeptidase family serine peptidase [Anaerolineales bacterium]
MSSLSSKVKIWLGVILILSLRSCGVRRNNPADKQLPAGWVESSIEFDGLTRWYRIYTPDTLPEKHALVLYLHGGTLSMRSLFSPLVDGTDRWFSIVEGEGVVLLVPNGVSAETGDTYGDDQNWNDLRQDSAAGQTIVNDVAFLMDLLDQVSVELNIDQDRIFVTGASNGGMMTYRLLIDQPDRFAAGAAFIANLPAPVENLPLPESPTPLLIANGTEDPLVPWEGGMVGKDRGWVISTEDTVNWWVNANQADSAHFISKTF